MRRIRLAIADDQRLFREALKHYLHTDDDFEVVINASNGSELINELKHTKVDVILLDLKMPVLSGWQTLPILSERYPKIRVIILSTFNADQHIVEGIKLGARSYLHKDCNLETLIDAIHTVYQEGFFFDKLTSRALRNKVADPHFEAIRVANESLTNRETQIVQLICSGKSNLEIADLLYISVRTVESHRKAIFMKTECSNVATLAIYAVKHGIFQIS